MDVAKWKQKIAGFLKKYKYAAVIILIGAVLMLIPGKREEEVERQESSTEPLVVQESVEQQLSGILSQIDGAGEVRVMLTIAAGTETIYQTDSDLSVTDDSSSSQNRTVIVTTSQKEEAGVVRQINPPVYMGAIIVCEGAESPAVQLAIVDAVTVVTGLGADRISVLKMK